MTHTGHFEQSDAYPDVIASWLGKKNGVVKQARLIRSIDSKPTTQWILQFKRKTTSRWDSDKYMQSKIGIDIFTVEAGVKDDSEAYAIIQALPDWCPQREERLRRPHDQATDHPAAPHP